jgi:hypothetical protein
MAYNWLVNLWQLPLKHGRSQKGPNVQTRSQDYTQQHKHIQKQYITTQK